MTSTGEWFVSEALWTNCFSSPILLALTSSKQHVPPGTPTLRTEEQGPQLVREQRHCHQVFERWLLFHDGRGAGEWDTGTHTSSNPALSQAVSGQMA